MSRVEEVVAEVGRVAESIDWWSLKYEDLESHEQLICPICRTGLVLPYQTSCGHTFCRECIFSTRDTIGGENGNNFRCPIDREVLVEELRPAPLVVASLVDDLVVFCPFESRGCQFKGKRWLLETHIAQDCQFVHVKCNLPCTDVIERRYFETNGCGHTANEMPETDTQIDPSIEEDGTSIPLIDDLSISTISCSGSSLGCGWKGSASDAEDHEKSCPMALIAPSVKGIADNVNSLKLENKALRRQLAGAERQARKEASELDAHLMAEHERLCRELNNATAARGGDTKRLMMLARENVRMTEEMAFLRSSMDGLHRQLNLAMMSQRRMSFYSSQHLGLYNPGGLENGGNHNGPGYPNDPSAGGDLNDLKDFIGTSSMSSPEFSSDLSSRSDSDNIRHQKL